MTAVIVLAKSPRPGWSKTRLCPPCSPEQAAGLAEAALIDTLAAVVATPVDRRVLALDGPSGSWLPPDVEIIPQRGQGLDERLAAAFADTGGPAVLIGMDTPQVSPLLLTDALDRLTGQGSGAVLGPAWDGGWWCLGLPRPDPAALLGVPMSTPHTAMAQRRRLVRLGLRVADMPVLRDVDDIEDAIAVATAAPTTRFAAALAAMGLDAARFRAAAR
jgi:glycosyltransferase A (GT-A) superfamily protein (DUF2064 family)